MRYLQMPFLEWLAISFFAEVMSQTEIIGALIIISSCLVIAWRELVRSQKLISPASSQSWLKRNFLLCPGLFFWER